MLKRIFSKIKFPLATAGIYLAITHFALAAQDPQTNCKNFQSQFNGAFDWVDLSHYCTASGLALFVIQLLLGFAGVVAVIFIILGGFWYLTSSGNEEQAEKGRKALTNAIIGLVVILLAVTIVRVVSSFVGAGK